MSDKDLIKNLFIADDGSTHPSIGSSMRANAAFDRVYYMGKDGLPYYSLGELVKADAAFDERCNRPIPKYLHDPLPPPDKFPIYDHKYIPDKLLTYGDKHIPDKIHFGGRHRDSDVVGRLTQTYGQDRIKDKIDFLLKNFLKSAVPEAVVMQRDFGDSFGLSLRPHPASKDPEFQRAFKEALEDWEKRQRPQTQPYKPSDAPVVLKEPKLKF